MSLRILTARDIKKILTMQEVIAVMKEAFIQLASGNVCMPLRTAIPIPKHQAVTLCMPTYISSTEQLGVKIVTLFPNNPQRGLPSIHGLVFLFNAQTGQPEALLDGSLLTALRTGAVSGLATDLLARPDASSVAIIGSGVQARTQLEAIACVRKIKQIWIYSRNPANAELFAQEVTNDKNISASIKVTHSAHEATKEADIICTATASTTPLIDIMDVRPGVHINAIGSHTEQMCEIGTKLVSQSKIIVDLRSAALAEAGEIIQSIRAGTLKENAISELGEVILDPTLGRTSPEQTTFFKSVGVAIQDISIADYTLKAAQKINQGKVVEI